MFAFAFYLLKVTICSGILFGYYWFMLRNKIFHQYNRFYLLAVVVLSLTLPIIQVNIWHAADAPAPKAIQLLQVVNSSNDYLDEIIVTSKPGNLSSEQGLALLYSIITVAFLAVFIQTIFRVRTLFKKHQHSLVENVYFVNTTAKGTPFSFLRYIFWNDHIDPESATGHQIFKHELAHVQQKHSYDKLFINATLIACWCNPFFWFIRKELNMIHEFMADKIAVEDSNTETFAAMILQATYPQHRFHLTNPFFYSPIKRRLLMLTKNNNSKVGYIGRILVLPLAVLVFAAFTLKAKTFKNSENPVYKGKKITVVVDAGHGGTDAGARSIDGSITEKELALAIIKKIKELNSNTNINLVLTRESDIYQTVQEKANFANAQHADLFVSIHIDGTSDKEADSKTGLSVYVAKDNFVNAGSSKLFASAVINEFKNNFPLFVSDLPRQRTVGIKILQESNCPAVLIEAGYITNENDLAYLKTDAGKERIASNILAAIERYAFAKEDKTGITNVSLPSVNQRLPVRKTDTVPELNLNNYDKALIIADGEVISNAALKQIKPENIQSISILKDKSAVELYGAKGKNGVIIIQLKEKEFVLKDLPVTVTDDTSSSNGTLSGNIIVRRNDFKIPGKQPLYVIDGKIKTESIDINSINPNDIKSINVIKGEHALKKYGEPGRNGVLEITTKNNPTIKEITITEASENKPLREVVMVGYGKFDTKNVQSLHDEPIFTVTENEPHFPGGQPAWERYLQKNLSPNLPIEEGWKPGQYKIMVSFIVRKDGSIADIKTNDYPGSKTSEHCMDLIRKGPKWEPAVQNGHMVNAYRTQPITFLVEKL
ncbi:MAG: N-acetylmuramoyl-L-alanine amidase [Sediminibacterium sp.]